MRRLIGLLQESLPGVKIHTIALDESTTQPISEILPQLPEGVEGPVMVTGLEKSNPSSILDHPVLQTLNLSRPEWPRRLPRPVVLWVPEYVLGLMGREAPDFLDWRSDTLHFPEELSRHDFAALSSGLWRTRETHDRTREPEHRARIQELQSRLAAPFDREDLIQCKARAGWWSELGNHLEFLGHLQEAEEAYRTALALEQEIGNEKGMAADLNNLAVLLIQRGDLDKAESVLREVLARFEQAGSRLGTATALLNVARISAGRGEMEAAQQAVQRAIRLLEGGPYEGLRIEARRFMGGLALQRGEVGKARETFQETLETSRKTGDLLAFAASLRSLGALDSLSGDLSGARAGLERALAIEAELGNLRGKASTLSVMGGVEMAAGNVEKARAHLSAARNLFLQMGSRPDADGLQAQLQLLEARGAV